MRYYVEINGVSSLTIQGLAISELPSISKPLIRTQREEIDGRDGDIITKLGYSAYDKSLKIGLWGNYNINEVIAFFNADGKITFSNEPDKYYYFTILNRADFINQLEAFRTATITIHCQPFKYMEQESPEFEREYIEKSGTSITWDNSLDAPIDIDLKGNTSQTGTPTPDAPIDVNVVSGDNSVVVSGINLEQGIEQGNINSSGVPYNDNTSIRSKYFDNVSPNTTYIVSKDGTAIGCNISQYDKNYTFISRTYYNNGSFTTSATTRYVKVQLAGTTTDKIQLQLGNTASTYEAYNGTTYNIDLPVENLLNLSNFTNETLNGITFTKNTDGSITLNGTSTGAFSKDTQISLLLNTGKYVLSQNTIYTSANYSLSIRDQNNVAIVGGLDSGNNSLLLNIGENITAYYFRIYIPASKTFNNHTIYPQVELGTNANAYTPYGTTPIELCKIGTYQDYFYKDSGKWYKKPMVLKIASYNGETITTDFISTTGELTTGATIYYKNPTENPSGIEITYTPLIEQLNTLEQAQSKEGTTNLTQVNNDLPFMITASVLCGTANLIVNNLGNIIAKPVMTITGSGDIGVYLNGSQIFNIALGDEEYITIDIPNMEAHKDDTLKNRLVVGDYNSFVLQPGENTISFTGDVSSFDITNYSRWI